MLGINMKELLYNNAQKITKAHKALHRILKPSAALRSCAGGSSTMTRLLLNVWQGIVAMPVECRYNPVSSVRF